ncbi:hypothetical protein AAVH_15708 [Aphelenchoides avenae]|nr:hypothetical protein AAVH_15708 [Aphelenchus avenae]
MRAPAAAFLLLCVGLVRVKCQGWDKSLLCEDGNPVVAPCVDGVCFLDTDLKCELKKDGTEYCCKLCRALYMQERRQHGEVEMCNRLPRRHVSGFTPGGRHYFDNYDDAYHSHDPHYANDSNNTNDPYNTYDSDDSDDHRNYANDANHPYHSYDPDNADDANDDGDHPYNTNDANYSYDSYYSNYAHNANNSDYANDANE